MHNYIIINSYNRESMLNRLIDQIKAQTSRFDTLIKVYLDGYKLNDYKDGVEYVFYPKNHGKSRYYKIVNDNFKHIIEAQYIYKIDDDMQLCDDFFKKSKEYWHSIKESNKLFLNLLRDQRDDMWDSGKTVIYNNNVRLSGWTDLNFMTDRRMYRLKDMFYFQPPPKGFTTSSGVGRQLTRIARNYGSIYQVQNSLLIHGDHKSQMNPNRKEKLTNI